VATLQQAQPPTHPQLATHLLAVHQQQHQQQHLLRRPAVSAASWQQWQQD